MNINIKSRLNFFQNLSVQGGKSDMDVLGKLSDLLMP